MQGHLNEALHVRSGRKRHEANVVEQITDRAFRPKIPPTPREGVPHIHGGSGEIVGEAVHDYRRAARTIALESGRLQRFRGGASVRAAQSAFHRILGHPDGLCLVQGQAQTPIGSRLSPA